jgi:hypothetical protein
MELVNIFLDPKVLSILGPVGLWAFLASIALYKISKRYDEIQEKRITENKEMQKEYLELAKDIERTLDVLIRTVGKKNGGGSI